MLVHGGPHQPHRGPRHDCVPPADVPHVVPGWQRPHDGFGNPVFWWADFMPPVCVHGAEHTCTHADAVCTHRVPHGLPERRDGDTGGVVLSLHVQHRHDTVCDAAAPVDVPSPYLSRLLPSWLWPDSCCRSGVYAMHLRSFAHNGSSRHHRSF